MFAALMLVLSSVQQALERPMTTPESIHRFEPGIAGGFEMANPGHCMLGSFSESGVSLEGEGWSARFAFAAWGRAGEMSAAVPVEPRAEGCRVEYHRTGITEWYVNGPRGLEQGFTIAAAPEGDGPVRIEMAVDGELEVEVLAGRRDARLLDDGRAVFHYVGLTAWDATGRHMAAALSAVESGLALEILDHGAVYPLTVDPWMGTEVAVLSPPAAPFYEWFMVFGSSLALQEDTLVVGAPGLNMTLGAVHVFYRDGSGAWGEVAKLTETFPHPANDFGAVVAIDGTTLVVGAPGATLNSDGVAYVYERHQGGPDAWGEVKQLVGNPGSDFGHDVAIDGDTIAIGAPGEDTAFAEDGVVYLFHRDQGGPGNWGLVQQLLSPTPDFSEGFGRTLALQGDTLLVGEPSTTTPGGTGAVQVFERTSGVWTGAQTLASDDGKSFGSAIAIDGDSLLVGAHSTPIPYSDVGAAYYFERVAGTWTMVQELTHPNPALDDAFGYDVAISGDLALVGAPERDGFEGTHTGAAYLFGRVGVEGDWTELQEFAASNPLSITGGPHYGRAVVLDGDTASIGAPDQSPGTIIGDVRSAAFDPLTGTLYGVMSQSLVRVDTSTGAGTVVGPTGFQSILGLAFDPNAGILYGVDQTTDQLIEIDGSTGMGHAIGSTGFGRIQGLAFDTSAGVLYGIDDVTDSLVQIDPATGAGLTVGPIAGWVRGLDYDSWTETLYGSEVLAEQLVAIDKHTGSTTTVGPLGLFPNVEGLAFDPASGTLYGIDKTEGGTLLTIDTSSGAGTAIGQISTFQGEAGAAYVITLEFEAETYCTAGTSASGCQALIGASGTASATASSGFSLLISGVEGQKDGLFFYGTNGRQANPWGNGTSYVCVVPPRLRGGLLTGVGTLGACDGSFDQDLNARWCPTCPKPNHNPGAGALVQAQLWYRDPLSTSNQPTSMSDAIEFHVGP